MKKKIVKQINELGFDCKRIETTTYRGFYGGTCNHVVVLTNKEGKMLSLDGKTPYCPIGREDAFLSILQNGGFKNESWI